MVLGRGCYYHAILVPCITREERFRISFIPPALFKLKMAYIKPLGNMLSLESASLGKPVTRVSGCHSGIGKEVMVSLKVLTSME